MAEDLDAVYQLTYEEAKQALANQASALDALRSRAGTLLQSELRYLSAAVSLSKVGVWVRDRG